MWSPETRETRRSLSDGKTRTTGAAGCSITAWRRCRRSWVTERRCPSRCGPHLGVVLFRSLCQREDGDSGRDADDSHRLYRRSLAGWEPGVDDGGTSGPLLKPLSRLDVPVRHASIRSEFRFGDLAGLTGIVGTAATTIELADGDGVTRRALEAPVSVFVVCFRFADDVTLRILDSDDRVLLNHSVRPRHGTPSG